MEKLYKSLDVDSMKKILISLEPAFGNFSTRGKDPLYQFFKENSAQWLNEAAVYES